MSKMSSGSLPESTDAVSPLGPIGPATVAQSEEETSAPWLIRFLYGSLAGRVVMSAYESLRATGTSVVCLSPWGDSSPLLLPCIRFRDLALHAVVTATGGMAAVASPIMEPVSEIVMGSLGSSILVQGGLEAGFEVGTKALNEVILDKSLEVILPARDSRFETTGVKSLLITLKYLHTVEDAQLGFYRSSLHKNSSLFSSVKDYLAVEKGWFSPYLFASGRRPIIPRTMKPDVIFCHGPFLSGDYKIGETLLAESAYVISLCSDTIRSSPSSLPSTAFKSGFSKFFHQSSAPSAQLPTEDGPSRLVDDKMPLRRMVIVLVGLKPHRKLWSTSARPSESVMYYQLLNGIPAIVLPVKRGAPLVSWDGLTLEQLWKIDLNKKEGEKGGIWGIVDILSEYLEFCVDFDRLLLNKEAVDGTVQDGDVGDAMQVKRTMIRKALTLMIIGAIRSSESKEVKEVDATRTGVAMWRMP